MASHDTARRPAIRPRHWPRHGRPCARPCGSAHAQGLANEVSRYKVVLWLGGGLVGCDTTHGWAAGLYRETGATRRRESHDTTRARSNTGPRYGRLCLRHGRPQATPRHGAVCARLGRSARGLCAQAEPRCAPGAPDPVLDSVHCFQSLFGTLFMNTVHEVFKKKIKSNQMK